MNNINTNKTDHHDVAEILLKVALNTIKQTNINKFLVLIYLHITFIILLAVVNPTTIRSQPRRPLEIYYFNCVLH
jgi:t-SNARE complex subunit (syntaxin)